MGYDTQYDVIVCGGGTSGVAAAIASARNGAKTLLIEKTGILGGQMSLSGPPGFAYARLFNPRGKRDIGGLVEETYQRLLKSGHALPEWRSKIREKAGYTFSYVDPEWWVYLIFEMMEEEGVELLLDTLVVGVTKEENTVTGIIVENANGRNEMKAKRVIDCTGEGYVAIQAGCETACVSRDTREEVEDMYRKCYDIKELGEIMGFYELRDMALKNGDWHPYSGAGFFLTPREGGHIQAHFQHSSQVDHALPTDAWDLTRCNIECRKQNMIAWRFFKNYVPGFEHAYITKTCTELRLREGPRIVGEYILTRDDVEACRQFEDTIGKTSFKAGGYHVAAMDTLAVCVDGKTDMAFPKDGGSYDIPYRCLLPKTIDNLLAAGKSVSTDRPAYLRYLHQTMVTGQAAGTAAALSVKKDVTPRELQKDIKELQDNLVAQGAILFETR